MNDCQRISVVDSHTAGEPTRVVIAGGPDLGIGPLVDRQMRLATRFDGFRRTVVCEPRGCDALVGALLCEPNDARSAAAALFFNNVGNLRMCVHGTIGLVVTLGHLGKIQAGRHRIETPAGVVEAELIDEHRVRVANVASYRTKKSVTVEIAGGRSVTGDVAYGGNWFFIAGAHDEALTPDRIEALTALAWSFR
jgi:4-hydroxyproline epimerase